MDEVQYQVNKKPAREWTSHPSFMAWFAPFRRAEIVGSAEHITRSIMKDFLFIQKSALQIQREHCVAT